MPIFAMEGEYGPREVELSNGIKMPILGLGTSHSGGYNQDTVIYALKHCKYRLIDTAIRYGCEERLQQAIQLSGVAREDIFLTSKLWCNDYGSKAARNAFQASLKRLGVEYLDLFMLHWPLCNSSCENKQKVLEETWRELELLYDEGLCQAIGVSNYYIDDLKKLMETSSVTPHVNQVEFHPFQNPKELLEFCKDHKVQVEGYCPLGKGRLLGKKVVNEVAKLCGRTAAQVLIRWSMQNEVVTIPKSTRIDGVKENSDVFNFKLSGEEMNMLNNLHDGQRSVDVKSVQEKIDRFVPNGYKLEFTKYEIEKEPSFYIH